MNSKTFPIFWLLTYQKVQDQMVCVLMVAVIFDIKAIGNELKLNKITELKLLTKLLVSNQNIHSTSTNLIQNQTDTSTTIKMKIVYICAHAASPRGNTFKSILTSIIS